MKNLTDYTDSRIMGDTPRVQTASAGQITAANTPVVVQTVAAPVPAQTASADDGEVEIDLVELAYLLWGKIWQILLSFVVGAVAAFLVTYFLITPMYTATARMYILASSSSSVVNLSDLQISNNLRSDYKELLTSRPILEKVIGSLGLDTTAADLAGKISITNPTDTRILNVTVTTPSPQLSADIANELVRQGQADLPAIMKTDEPSIFEDAVVPLKKSSPSFTKNTAIGGLLAAVLYCAVVIIRYMLNDTLVTPDDVYKAFGIQPLATIPEGNLGAFSRELHTKKTLRSTKKHKHKGDA